MIISVQKTGKELGKPIQLLPINGRTLNGQGLFFSVQGRYPYQDIIVNLSITKEDIEYFKHINFEGEKT